MPDIPKDLTYIITILGDRSHTPQQHVTAIPVKNGHAVAVAEGLAQSHSQHVEEKGFEPSKPDSRVFLKTTTHG